MLDIIIKQEVIKILFYKKNVTKSLMVIFFMVLVFNITSDAKSSDVNFSEFESSESLQFKNVESRADTGSDCEYCYGNIYRGIEKIYARTDMTGSRCYHCTRQSRHKTKVYALREVFMCPGFCSYETIEYLPAGYECYSLK